MDIAKAQKTDNQAEATQQLRVSDALNGTGENFDLLPSKINNYIFKYGYLYILVFYLLYILGTAFISMFVCNDKACRDIYFSKGEPTISVFSSFVGSVIVTDRKLGTTSVRVLFIVIGAILLLLLIKIWRAYAPTMLQDLIENNRISAPGSNVKTRYAEFLKGYHRDLSRPISYLPGIILLLYAIFDTVYMVHYLSNTAISPQIYFTGFYLLLSVSLSLSFFILLKAFLLYIVGLTFSITFTTGRYLRKLLRDFQVKGDPIHLDKCAGLKILGTFCLKAALPLLSSSLYFLAYALVILIGLKVIKTEPVDLWVILILSLLAFLLVIWASILPIWMIHTKMVHDREIHQQNQSMELNALQNQMQELLHNNQLEQAKIIKEKRDLVETLYAPYPMWPFTLKAPILSSLLLSSVSMVPSIISTVLTWFKK